MYKYFNPNPTARMSASGKPMKWHKGDCSIRAICKATGMSWTTAYDFAFNSARKVFDVPNFTCGFEQVMKDLGFVKVSYAKGQKRETVKKFCENHPDKVAIISLASHYVCCHTGDYYDVWDCGNKTAYCYYEKQ